MNNNSIIKNLEVYTLEKFVSPLDKSDLDLFCSLDISNMLLKPKANYKVVLKISNIKKENRSRLVSSDSLIRKIKSKTKENNVVDSISFNKNYTALNSRKITKINFNAVIRKNEFLHDQNSKFFLEGIVNLKIFLLTNRNELVSTVEKEVNLNLIDVIKDKRINHKARKKEKVLANSLNNFLKTIRFFSNNENNSFIFADTRMLSELSTEHDLNSYKLIISLNNKDKSGKQKLTNVFQSSSFFELEFNEFFDIVGKEYSFSKKRFVDNGYAKKFIHLIFSKHDVEVSLILVDKVSNKEVNNKINFMIKKDNIEKWFLSLFYNVYLKNYFENKANCRLLDSSKNSYSITFDSFKKDDIDQEALLLEKYSKLVKVNLFKKSLVNRKTVVNDVIVDNLENKVNSSKLSTSIFNIKSNASKSKAVYFKSHHAKESDEEYLCIEYFLENETYTFNKKTVNIKIKDIEKESPKITIDKNKNMSSYYDISYLINLETKNNIMLNYNKKNTIEESLELYFDFNSLIKKEYYSLLGYENFEDFSKSLLLSINVEIFSGEKIIFKHRNLNFLEKYFDESFITKNLISKEKNNIEFYDKNCNKIIRNTSKINAKYFVEVALLRKETYENICKISSDNVKSILYRDSYDINSSNNFTSIEKIINIIHSNNTSFEKAKSNIFQILYSKDFKYKKYSTIKAKEK